jgi:hypothetical protein
MNLVTGLWGMNVHVPGQDIDSGVSHHDSDPRRGLETRDLGWLTSDVTIVSLGMDDKCSVCMVWWDLGSIDVVRHRRCLGYGE